MSVDAERLRNVFKGILEDWKLAEVDIASLDWVEGPEGSPNVLVVKDRWNQKRVIPDMDRKLYEAIVTQPVERGTVTVFDEDGNVDPYA